ncbi:TIGR04282 family arsenosugar biosynthesis glycosyltransferase [Aquimarina litoralis]|uniref:TIGR04282 family arsenosugar biosynthesis glycosyltransferase n=1 Tax=Aquimarina litoralis TaxID=584605 RepID=UPI001C59C325|nr:DUF2064 domain-containing protein [Aquimarina litoralis]MBW1295444.1 DUF2064 domain-containing protein [Aquimarina litoralis]
MKLKTAILVFANSSKQEVLNKPIFGGDRLFSALNKATLKVVKSTGIPFFVYTEKDQIGNSFGERFVNALQATYDQGFENVITIGNDTPHLRKQHLIESVKQLENKNFVLGPSADGGFYLMGLHKSQFNRNTFLKLPWQSKNLAKSVSLLIKTSKIEVAQLETLFDIDTLEDLHVIAKLSNNISMLLRKIIQSILSIRVDISKHRGIIKNTYQQNSFYNKGSPLLIENIEC